MDYSIRLAKDYSKRTLENYVKCKKKIDNEVTFLLNCLLGILTVTMPGHPYKDTCYISKELNLKEFLEFDLKKTVLENKNKDYRMLSYLYSIRNSSVHRYDKNFERILCEDKIYAIEFISGTMTIRLTIEQIEKLMIWIVENVR